MKSTNHKPTRQATSRQVNPARMAAVNREGVGLLYAAQCSYLLYKYAKAKDLEHAWRWTFLGFICRTPAEQLLLYHLLWHGSLRCNAPDSMPRSGFCRYDKWWTFQTYAQLGVQLGWDWIRVRKTVKRLAEVGFIEHCAARVNSGKCSLFHVDTQRVFQAMEAVDGEMFEQFLNEKKSKRGVNHKLFE